MKIVIVGDGKVGSALTEQLSKENHDVVVIDSNKMVLQEAQQALDVNVVHGNGASLKIQKLANVDTSDLLIAATSADEINLLCCIVARKLGCRHTIARVRNPEYYGQRNLPAAAVPLLPQEGFLCKGPCGNCGAGPAAGQPSGGH